MADIGRHVTALIERITRGDGRASREARTAVFAKPDRPLLEKVAQHAYRVTDEDVAAEKSARSEDEVFELVVCTAVGQAKRQYDSALAALDEAAKGA